MPILSTIPLIKYKLERVQEQKMKLLVPQLVSVPTFLSFLNQDLVESQLI